VSHGGVNQVGIKKVLLQEGLQQNAAHLACAQNGHTDLGQLRGNFGGLNGYLRHVFPYLEWESCKHYKNTRIRTDAAIFAARPRDCR
jgi:hypothetical protein